MKVIITDSGSPPRRMIELVCDEATFAKLTQLIVEQVEELQSKTIQAEEIGLIGIHRRRPPVNDSWAGFRDKVALAGCAASVFIGMAAFSLMGLGLAVVLGWINPPP
jgi:hypothetical protein